MDRNISESIEMLNRQSEISRKKDQKKREEMLRRHEGLSPFPNDLEAMTRRIMEIMRISGFTNAWSPVEEENSVNDVHADLPDWWFPDKIIHHDASSSVIYTLQMCGKTTIDLIQEVMEGWAEKAGKGVQMICIDTKVGVRISMEEDDEDDPVWETIFAHEVERGGDEEPRLWIEYSLNGWESHGFSDLTDYLVSDYTSNNRDDPIFIDRLECEDDPGVFLQDFDPTEHDEPGFEAALAVLHGKEDATEESEEEFFNEMHINLVNPTMFIPVIAKTRRDVVREIRRYADHFGCLEGSIHKDMVKKFS